MVTLAETIRMDLIGIIQDDPTSFEWKENEYTGTSSGVSARRPLEIGGFEDQPELTISINIKQLDGGDTFGQDIPKVGDRITVENVTYRIDRTEVDSFGECLQMDLRSQHK